VSWLCVWGWGRGWPGRLSVRYSCDACAVTTVRCLCVAFELFGMSDWHVCDIRNVPLVISKHHGS